MFTGVNRLCRGDREPRCSQENWNNGFIWKMFETRRSRSSVICTLPRCPCNQLRSHTKQPQHIRQGFLVNHSKLRCWLDTLSSIRLLHKHYSALVVTLHPSYISIKERNSSFQILLYSRNHINHLGHASCPFQEHGHQHSSDFQVQVRKCRTHLHR